MPIRFWGRKERQTHSAPELNPYSRLDDPMLMDLLGRVAQLTGQLELIAGAMTDMVEFQRDVVRFASSIAETAAVQRRWLDAGTCVAQEPGRIAAEGKAPARVGPLLAEAAQLSRNCAHRSVRIMEGVQAMAEMAEESILLLLHSCPEPVAVAGRAVGRTDQLSTLAERTRQRSAEIISLLHQLGQNHDALRQMLHACQDDLSDEAGANLPGQPPALVQEARDRAGQLCSMADALTSRALQQTRDLEQIQPAAENLRRDAGEIRKLLEALISEGTAATIP